MALEEKEQVDGLCKQICIEQDQQRLTALVAELNKLLAIKEHVPSPASRNQ